LDGEREYTRTAEIDRLNRIIDEAEKYQTAEALRQYARKLSEEGESNPETADEIKWILKKADWMDPFINRHDPIFGEREALIDEVFLYKKRL